MKAGFDRLIKYQNIELHQLETTRNLHGIPHERDMLEKKLAHEREVLDQALQGLRALELRQKESEGDREQTEATVTRFRSQLLEVKKNDQYQALLKEIETCQNKISDLEETEIEVLDQIDVEKERVKADELAFRDREKEIRSQMKLLVDRKAQLEQTLTELGGALAEAKAEVPPVWDEAYARVKNQVRKGPWVVQLQGTRCEGCHLSVSSEVAHNFGESAGVNYCDQCGRVLYRG